MLSRFFLAEFPEGDRRLTADLRVSAQFVLVQFKFKLRLGHVRTLRLEATPALLWLAASPTRALPL